MIEQLEHIDSYDYGILEIPTNLSIDNAVQKMPQQYQDDFRMVYEWFVEHAGESGKKLTANDLPFQNADFKPSATLGRGIHVPAVLPKGEKYALTITSRWSSIYSQEAGGELLIEQDDGTWILCYCAHTNNKGGSTDPQWNRALMANCRDGVPVGVYIETGPNTSRYRYGLAYVEDYRPDADAFILRGPVTKTNEAAFALPEVELPEQGESAPTVQELLAQQREYKSVPQKKRSGQAKFREKLLTVYSGHCAVTDCSVDQVLQAAHIIDHRGPLSNTSSNGLLLRADIHLLFDHDLLAFEPSSMTVSCSKRLANTEYEVFQGSKLLLPSSKDCWPDERYLSLRYGEFITAEQIRAS